MKNRPELLNKYYSLFLIAAGLLGFLWRYSVNGDFQFTALIPTLFGVILLPMSDPIKKDNHLIAHIAVTITLVFGLMAIYMFVTSLLTEDLNIRRVILFGLMSVASVYVTTMYVLRFIGIKKQKQLQAKA